MPRGEAHWNWRGHIITILRDDMIEATGPLQFCAGQDSVRESAVHFIRKLYDDDDSVEAILLVDASNAFNSLNREAALRNSLHLYPS